MHERVRVDKGHVTAAGWSEPEDVTRKPFIERTQPLGLTSDVSKHHLHETSVDGPGVGDDPVVMVGIEIRPRRRRAEKTA